MKTKIFFDINFKMEGVILSFWHFNFSNKNMHVRRTMPYKFFLYSNNIIFKCNCFYEQFSKKKNYKHIYTVYYVVRNKKTPLNYLYASTEFLHFLLIWPRQIFTSLNSVLNSNRCTKDARIWGKNSDLRVSIDLRKVVDGRAWCYKFVKTKYQ